jgi:acetyl-CoA acetyltransferase/uncharacterized OB-fold protein
VTGPKRTALGEGWFVTTRSTWYAGDEPVATMDFRILKFRPSPRPAPAGTVLRPPASPDTAFFWAGTAAGELRIQECGQCGARRHPPGPMCPRCGAAQQREGGGPGYVVAAGTGTVYSYVVHHHPPVPGKTLPLVIALVELPEGVRVLAGMPGTDPGQVRIGMPVQVGFERIDDELTLPGRPSRPRPSRRPGQQGHLREHPDQHRAGPAVRVRLGRARRGDQVDRHPARRALLRRGHADVLRPGRAGRGRRADGHRDRPVQRRRSRDRHGPGLATRECGVTGRAAAIAGLGATEFSKDSGRSELQLAAEAVRAALDDAGLTAADVDGLVTFVMDSSAEIAVARELGAGELTFFSQIGYGGGAACAIVQQAALAVAAGVAEVVVCYRALNERSGRRFGQVSAAAVAAANSAGIDNGWHYPMGLSTPAATVAMAARRYMHEYGATSADFGAVAVADRRHAAVNPHAWFYQRPITLAEHQASRWIAEPLRLLDCCQESDGAVAVVVTSLERAAGLRRPPAVILAAAQGSGQDQFTMTSYYRDGLSCLPEMGVVGRQLWRQSGAAPDDVRTAVLYDHFTPYVLMQLEELGFCPRGEARGFIAEGAIEIGGALPLNTHGGQLGEAYIHGMNGIAEAVRQIRGTSVNQVPGDGPVLVTAGTGVPTSGLILGPDR